MKTRKKRTPTLICDYCNTAAARKTRLNHTFGKGADMIVVQNVETVVCDNCGTSYMEGKALLTLNEILKNPDEYGARQAIVVADFKQAA
ncbi:MAG: YgiT-type zinc finger protein [Blastocatellia bacterium]